MMDHEDKDPDLRHRILPTNDILCKMGMETNTKCGICKQEKETVEHLFIYCKKLGLHGFLLKILYVNIQVIGIYFSMIVTIFWVMGKTLIISLYFLQQNSTEQFGLSDATILVKTIQ